MAGWHTLLSGYTFANLSQRFPRCTEVSAYFMGAEVILCRLGVWHVFGWIQAMDRNLKLPFTYVCSAGSHLTCHVMNTTSGQAITMMRTKVVKGLTLYRLKSCFKLLSPRSRLKNTKLEVVLIVGYQLLTKLNATMYGLQEDAFTFGIL